eukprot:1289865-Rhodomonas_salina.2
MSVCEGRTSSAREEGRDGNIERRPDVSLSQCQPREQAPREDTDTCTQKDTDIPTDRHKNIVDTKTSLLDVTYTDAQTLAHWQTHRTAPSAEACGSMPAAAAAAAAASICTETDRMTDERKTERPTHGRAHLRTLTERQPQKERERDA